MEVFLPVYIIECKGEHSKCLSITIMIIHSFSGMSIQLFLLIFAFGKYEAVNDKMFPILFIIHNIITIIIYCYGKNKEIKIDESKKNQNNNALNDRAIVSYRRIRSSDIRNWNVRIYTAEDLRNV